MLTTTGAMSGFSADDTETARAFYRDTLGLDFIGDVERGGSFWATLTVPGQGVSIVLSDPYGGRSQEDGDAMAKLMAKGALNGISFATSSLEETFEKVRASGAEVMQEPMDQPWGARDCAFRDPSGNMVRINQG